MIKELNKLIEEWEKEALYLTNPHDEPLDKAVGKTYQKCANAIKEVVKHASQPTNQQEQVEVCSNCGVKKGFHHLDNCHEYGVF